RALERRLLRRPRTTGGADPVRPCAAGAVRTDPLGGDGDGDRVGRVHGRRAPIGRARRGGAAAGLSSPGRGPPRPRPQNQGPPRPGGPDGTEVPSMRKVIWMNSLSLDGFFEGPNREIGWHQVDDELHRHLNDALAPMGAFLAGRVTYLLMAEF